MVTKSKRWERVKPILIPLILFVGLIGFAAVFSQTYPYSGWIYALALLPIFPVIWLGLRVTQAFYRLDELQKKIITDGMVFSLVHTVLILIALELLGAFTVLDYELDAFAFAVLMVVLWFVGRRWGNRRYR